MLKSLKVLSILNDKMGAYLVDMMKYLFSSLLSRVVASDWNFSEFANIQYSDAANKYRGTF